MPIRRTASRPASASSSSARATEGALRQAFGSGDRWLTRKTRRPRRKPKREKAKGTRASRRRAEGAAQGDKGGEGQRPRPRSASQFGTPRLKTHFDEVMRKLTERVRLQEPHAGAAARQDRAQHGHRRGRHRPQEGRGRGRRPGADRRPEGGDHQGAQVDRDLQAARGPADRLQGDAAQASACTSSSTGW